MGGVGFKSPAVAEKGQSVSPVQSGYTTVGGMRYDRVKSATTLATALKRAFVLSMEEMLS